MGRAPCCDKANVKKGPWSPEEDTKLKEYIEKYGTGGNWIALPQKADLKRCGKSCRLRWLNYLRPNIKHGDFTDEEDLIICNLYTTIGSRWSIIAAQLPGRTDNDIKNYWNTKLKKKLMVMAPPPPHLHQQRKQSQFPYSSNQTTFNYTPQLPPISTNSISSLLYKDLLSSNTTTNNGSYYYSPTTTTNKTFNLFESITTSPMNSSPSTNLVNTNSSLLQYYHNIALKDHSTNTNTYNMLSFGSNEGSCSSNSEASCGQQISYGGYCKETGGNNIKQEESTQIGLLQLQSYNNNSIISNGFEEKFMLSNYNNHEIMNSNNNNVNGDASGNGGVGHGENHESMNLLLWGDHNLDLVEDVKLLLNNNNNNDTSNNIGSGSLFSVVDENKSNSSSTPPPPPPTKTTNMITSLQDERVVYYYNY